MALTAAVPVAPQAQALQDVLFSVKLSSHQHKTCFQDTALLFLPLSPWLSPKPQTLNPRTPRRHKPCKLPSNGGGRSRSAPTPPAAIDDSIEEELIYEKLPHDISERHVLLMDPILGTGNSASRVIQVGNSSTHVSASQNHELDIHCTGHPLQSIRASVPWSTEPQLSILK